MQTIKTWFAFSYFTTSHSTNISLFLRHNILTIFERCHISSLLFWSPLTTVYIRLQARSSSWVIWILITSHYILEALPKSLYFLNTSPGLVFRFHFFVVFLSLYFFALFPSFKLIFLIMLTSLHCQNFFFQIILEEAEAESN